MVITRRGDAENGHYASRWCWKWTFPVEVVSKIVMYQDSRYRFKFVPTDLKILKFGSRFKIKICIWTLRINPTSRSVSSKVFIQLRHGGVYFVSEAYEKSGSELTGKILRFGRFSLGTYFFEIGISFLLLFPEIWTNFRSKRSMERPKQAKSVILLDFSRIFAIQILSKWNFVGETRFLIFLKPYTL